MKALLAAAILATMSVAVMASDYDQPPGPGTPTTLPLSYFVQGLVDFDGDADAYRVNLVAGVDYGFWVMTSCRGKVLNVYNGGWQPLRRAAAVDRPEKEGWAQFRAPYTGLYYVQYVDVLPPAGADCSETPSNDYFIFATPTCAPGLWTNCKLQLGTMVSSTLWAWNDRDWRILDITTAGTYSVAGFGNRVGIGWPWGGAVVLRRADGSVIADSEVSLKLCSIGEACVRAWLVPGRYYVAIRMPEQTSSVEYRLVAVKGGL